MTVMASFAMRASAKTITVTTTNSEAPPVGEVSLKQAIQSVQNGDSIQFALPGVGPFFLPTPPGGYPWVRASNVTIDGYSQMGSGPNTNGILGVNSARLAVVVDSRNGNVTSMNYAPSNPKAGYSDTEFALLGVFNSTNVVIRGLGFLAPPVDSTGTTNYYGVSFARDGEGDASGGRISGCWIGVAPDGKAFTPITYAVTAFRHRDADGQNPRNIDRITVGVPPGSTNARGDFNVVVPSALPIVLEGNGHRVSGNFLNVFPDGTTEYNVALDAKNFSQNNQAQGMIQIGRGGDNTVIGTDGDGIHDADERNVMAGTLPKKLNGYDHSIEFYGNNPGTNIIIAGNYIGIGVDGKTRFTNSVPVLNAAGEGSVYRLGSNLDGISDDIEGNLIANNWPFEFIKNSITNAPPSGLSFFDGLAPTTWVSARGNSFLNNYSFPISPLKTDTSSSGYAIFSYYSMALDDSTLGVSPVLSQNPISPFFSGTVPLAAPGWGPILINLYRVDLESLTNSSFLTASGLTNGWVQGRSYLGSFQVDGTNDLDPAENSFTFYIGSLDILTGSQLTATANYLPPGGGPALTSPFSNPVTLRLAIDNFPPRLNITLSGNQFTITWFGPSLGYRLQTTDNLGRPDWLNVPGGTQQPVRVDITTNPQFFRLAQ